MLVPFFALGRFLGALGPLLRVSWLLVAVLGWFCHVRDRSGDDFRGFGTLPGGILEPPASFFPWFRAHACVLSALAQDMQKPEKNLGKT